VSSCHHSEFPSVSASGESSSPGHQAAGWRGPLQHAAARLGAVEGHAVSPGRCHPRRWGGKTRGKPGDSFSEHSPRERPPIRAAVPEGMNTEGKCPQPPFCSCRRWRWWTPSRDKAPEGGLTRRTISPLGALFSTITDDMGASRDFGSPDDWNNPSIERRTNPVARLFKAFGAWHFLTRIGSVLLILGAVNVVVSVALLKDVGQARLWLFSGAVPVVVCLGVWRKRRATSPGITHHWRRNVKQAVAEDRVKRFLRRPPRGRRQI